VATNLVAKIGQNYLPPALIALPFRNGMRYHNRNQCVNSVNDVSILCERFMKFGPVTPELTLLICERLRSAHTRQLTVPRTNTSHGDRSFAVAGPPMWNSLPAALRLSDSTLATFRTQLKTLLFVCRTAH